MFQTKKMMFKTHVNSCCDYFLRYKGYTELFVSKYPPTSDQVFSIDTIINNICSDQNYDCNEIMKSPYFDEEYKKEKCCSDPKYTEDEICKKSKCETEFTKEKCMTDLKPIIELSNDGNVDMEFRANCCYCHQTLKQQQLNKNPTSTELAQEIQEFREYCKDCKSIENMNPKDVNRQLKEKCCAEFEKERRFKLSKQIIQLCYPDDNVKYCNDYPGNENCCDVFAESGKSKEEIIAIIKGSTQVD